jgi:hypothetical protein
MARRSETLRQSLEGFIIYDIEGTGDTNIDFTCAIRQCDAARDSTSTRSVYFCLRARRLGTKDACMSVHYWVSVRRRIFSGAVHA